MNTSNNLTITFSKRQELNKHFDEFVKIQKYLVDHSLLFENAQPIRPSNCRNIRFNINSIKALVLNIIKLLEKTQLNKFQTESSRYRLLMLLYKVDNIANQISLLMSQFFMLCTSLKAERVAIQYKIFRKFNDLVCEIKKIEMEREKVVS